MMVVSISHAHEARAKSIVASAEHWSHAHVDISERREFTIKRMRVWHKGTIAHGPEGRNFIWGVRVDVVFAEGCGAILRYVFVFDEIIVVIVVVIIVWFAHSKW